MFVLLSATDIYIVRARTPAHLLSRECSGKSVIQYMEVISVSLPIHFIQTVATSSGQLYTSTSDHDRQLETLIPAFVLSVHTRLFTFVLVEKVNIYIYICV